MGTGVWKSNSPLNFYILAKFKGRLLRPLRLHPENMAFSEEEKDLVVQSLQYYLQQAGAQLPPQAVQQLMTLAKSIVTKLDQPGAGGEGPKAGEPPPGISQDWYDHVCVTCPQLKGSTCLDKITVKFPGKCDPILLFERQKTAA